jgi:outer membrane receptor protein involved in Fe transport
MRVAVIASVVCLSAVALAHSQGAKADAGGSSESRDVENDAQAAPSVSGNEQVAEVTVTAQRREERLQNVPISISVLSGDELNKTSFQGVSEALNSVPGTATTETYLGGGTNISIRGVGAEFPLFTGPSAVAYYLDSVPFGLIKSAIGPDANGYDLARVEVLRGPQGTLYGASALNGVVRILTNDANLHEFDFKTRVSGSYTDDGSGNYRADATLNAPFVADKLAVRATLGYLHNSGWIDQPDDPNANYTNVATYRLKLNAQPIDNLTVGLSAWRSQQNSGAPNLGYTFDQSHSVLDLPSSTVYDAYGLKLGYQFNGFSVTSATSYLDYRNEGRQGLDVPGFGVPGAVFYSQLKSNVASEELNLNSTLDGPWRWSFGGIYRHGTEDLFQTLTVIPLVPPTTNDTSKSYAVYGELTRSFFDKQLEITAGARHFHDDLTQNGQGAPNTPIIYASSTAEANTPRAVITWHATRDVIVYASYSQGFRSGFPQETSVLEALPSFPPVKPDRLRNYELGTKSSLFDGRLALDASIYHMDWSDIQLLLATAVNGIPYPGVVNGAHARGNGLDLALTWKVIEGLTVSPYVSWNNLAMASDVVSNGVVLYHEGDRPSGSPETTAGISADYAFSMAKKRASFSVSGNYISAQSYRSLPATQVLLQTGDALFICRARLALELSDHWTATLYGDNLNNWHGTTAIMYPGVVPDWQARVRPLTVGLQAEYHMH